MALKRENCKKDHPFTDENTIRHSNGNRQCRKCFYEYNNSRRRKKRQERGLKSHSLKTHCAKGHPFNEENTHVRKRGGRECKTCRREGMMAKARANGVKPAIRLTREQKLANRRRWQHKRMALIRGVFVEDINPLVVKKRDNNTCGICGKLVEGSYEIDHKIPISRGGEHSYANVQLAHPRCNRKKWAVI